MNGSLRFLLLLLLAVETGFAVTPFSSLQVSKDFLSVDHSAKSSLLDLVATHDLASEEKGEQAFHYQPSSAMSNNGSFASNGTHADVGQAILHAPLDADVRQANPKHADPRTQVAIPELSNDGLHVRKMAGKGSFSQLFCLAACCMICGLLLSHEVAVAFIGRAVFLSDATVQVRRQGVQLSFFGYWVLMMMDPSVLIPTSYELAEKMGCSPTISGLLVSCGYLASPVGSIGGAVLFRRCSSATCRLVAILGVLLIMLGNLIMGITLDSHAEHGPDTMWFLIVVRFVCGLGKIAFVIQYVVYNVTPSEDKVQLSIGCTLASNLGLCLGPCLSAAVIHMIGGKEVVSSVFARTSCQIYYMALLWAILGIIFALTLPVDHNELIPEAAEEQVNSTVRARARMLSIPIDDRKSIVFAGLLFQMERCLCAAAIEAGSAMILETQYGWGTRAIGFSISACFATTIVVCIIIMHLFGNGYVGDVNGLVSLSLISVFGALLLFDFETGIAAQILVADILIHPFMACANGVSDGIVTRLAVPGTWFSMEAYMAVRNAGGPVCRFFGFPLARYLLDKGGRQVYAMVIMVVGISGLFSCLKIGYLVEWKLAKAEKD